MIEKQRNGRYKATLVIKRRRFPLGAFDTREEAEAAVEAARANPSEAPISAPRTKGPFTIHLSPFTLTLTVAQAADIAGVTSPAIYQYAKRHRASLPRAILTYLTEARDKDSGEFGKKIVELQHSLPKKA